MATHGLRRTFRERAVAVGITPQVLFDWLRRGRLTGKQLAKAMPWQITLTPEQAIELRAKVRRTNRSRRHHESAASPKTLGHSPKPRLEVRIIAPRS
jgi:transposase-like protein